jgi:hypothetical protein
MKKIIPLLIVGMLVLIVLGAAAVPYNKEQTMPISSYEVQVKLKKGFGFGIVAIVNWTGDVPETLECDFYAEASVMLLGQASIRMFNPQLEPPGDQIRSKLLFGFGPAPVIKVVVKDPTGLEIAQDSSTGLILGPFVYVKLK